MAQGRSVVRGYETLSASPRKIEVARAYVEGLERKSKHYNEVMADHLKLNAQALELAAHCLTLERCLSLLVARGEELPVTVYEILDNAQVVLDKVWECPCGHASFDHDEKGCTYLGCKPICGK